MLTGFCDNMGLKPVVRHEKCRINYTYDFDMCRLSKLDHFLLSGSNYFLSQLAVLTRACVILDVDNISDHEPIALQLLLCRSEAHVGFCDRNHTPRVSWVKVNDSDLGSYRCAFDHSLCCIKLPTDGLLCTALQYNDLAHFPSVNNYARELSGAYMDATEATIPHSCNRQSSGRGPGWSERIHATITRKIIILAPPVAGVRSAQIRCCG